MFEIVGFGEKYFDAVTLTHDSDSLGLLAKVRKLAVI